MNADRDIARVRELRPVVADLAKSLSLSAHIDVSLVRALRMKLFSDADVSSEADLWASPLVDSRREGALTLRTDVREQFWAELRADREALAQLWAVLDIVRTDTRPLVLLEERLTYCALVQDSDGIERELNKVINAMVADVDRRPSLATWAAQALAHLPASVRESDAAKILGSVARAWVPTPTSVAALTPTPDAMSLVEQLRPPTGKLVTIWVARSSDLVEASLSPLPGSVAIPNVSAANPILFVGHDRSYRIAASGTTRIEVPGSERVMLGTSDRRRWWLEPRQERPSTDSIVFPEIEDKRRACYLVTPNRMASCHLISSSLQYPIYVALGDRTENLDPLETSASEDVAILRLSNTSEEPPLEFEFDVVKGQTWQAFTAEGTRVLGMVISGWPRLMLRPTDPSVFLVPGTPIFIGAKVIGHIASDGSEGDLLHAISARTIKGWIDRALQEPLERADEPRATSTHRPSDVWVQSIPGITGEIPTRLEGPIGAHPGDLVVMFTDGPRPMGIYRVLPSQPGLESLPNNSARSALRMERSLWGVDRKTLEGAAQLVEGLRVTERPTRADKRDVYRVLDQLDRPRRAGELEAIVGEDLWPEILVEVPRVSMDGLLGEITSVEERTRRHSYGAFRVVQVEPHFRGGTALDYRVQVTASETDLRHAHMEFAVRLFQNPGQEAFTRACEVAAESFMAEVIRGPRRGRNRGDYDLQLVVSHVPHVAPAHAYRRGIQFVVAALDAMDFPGERRDRSYATIADAHSLDLIEAQERVATLDQKVRLIWIDPETDIVELRFEEGADPTLLHDALARVLERRSVQPVPMGNWKDLLFGRFGLANHRAKRVMNVEIRGDARVSVRSTIANQPMTGYVAFYFTSSERTIEMTRVRAVGGVAELRIPLRAQSFAVGAVIEDEGLMLEHWVGPTRETGEEVA